MTATTIPTRTSTCCPDCGQVAREIAPQGPSAILLCLCRPCDRMWRVKVVDA